MKSNSLDTSRPNQTQPCASATAARVSTTEPLAQSPTQVSDEFLKTQPASFVSRMGANARDFLSGFTLRSPTAAPAPEVSASLNAPAVPEVPADLNVPTVPEVPADLNAPAVQKGSRKSEPAKKAVLNVLHHQLAAAIQQQAKQDFPGALELLKQAHETAIENGVDFRKVLETYPVHFSATSMLMGDSDTWNYMISNELAFSQVAHPELDAIVMGSLLSVQAPENARVIFKGRLAAARAPKATPASCAHFQTVVSALIKTRNPAYIVDIVGNVHLAARFAIENGEFELAKDIFRTVNGMDGDFSKNVPDALLPPIGPPPPYKN